VSWWAWTLLVVVLFIVIVGGWYLSSTAGRLDRLHRRVDTGEVALDRALLERTSVAGEVAAARMPDPALAAVIGDAVHTARRTDPGDLLQRSLAESNLTAALGAAFDEPDALAECRAYPGGAELMGDLESATRRVQLSRTFLNDAVRACRDVRYQWLVRVFRLAGHTPWPEPFEMDDTPPAGFGIR